MHSGVAPPKYLVFLHSGAGVVFLLLVLRQSHDAVFKTESALQQTGVHVQEKH